MIPSLNKKCFQQDWRRVVICKWLGLKLARYAKSPIIYEKFNVLQDRKLQKFMETLLMAYSVLLKQEISILSCMKKLWQDDWEGHGKLKQFLDKDKDQVGIL
uniref:integrase repeat-containing protein n=1 Tax=Tumidithrix elongata TaxID=3088357 RepID=UPI0038CDA1BD